MLSPDRLNQIRKYRNGSDIVRELCDHIGTLEAQLAARSQASGTTALHALLDTFTRYAVSSYRRTPDKYRDELDKENLEVDLQLRDAALAELLALEAIKVRLVTRKERIEIDFIGYHEKPGLDLINELLGVGSNE